MLINTSWLKNNLHRQDIKVIDASWYLPNSGRNAFEEYKKSHIPKAVFFDIDRISNKKTVLPHMLPSINFFVTEIKVKQTPSQAIEMPISFLEIFKFD